MSRKGKRVHKTGVIIAQLLIAMPVLSILLALAAAKMILSGVIAEGKIMVCVYVIAAITAFVLSLYCAIRMPQKKALWGLATAASYAVALLLGNLLFFGVGYGSILPTVGIVLGAGLLASLLGAGKRRKYA